MKRVLYLGLRPPPASETHCYVHLPLIETVPRPQPILKVLWGRFSHVLFTSPRSVAYFREPLEGKVVVAIGEGTAEELRKRGCAPCVAEAATQEGMIEWIERRGVGGFWCLPQSSRSRPLLSRYLRERGVPHYSFVLYETRLKRVEEPPRLEEFDEVFFTSPSTVEAFRRIYREVPPGIGLRAIGPVTEREVKTALLCPRKGLEESVAVEGVKGAFSKSSSFS